MGRKPNAEKTRKVEPRLHPKAYKRLEMLVQEGTYGSNPTEVSKYLILRELDDLRRAGLFGSEADN